MFLQEEMTSLQTSKRDSSQSCGLNLQIGGRIAHVRESPQPVCYRAGHCWACDPGQAKQGGCTTAADDKISSSRLGLKIFAVGSEHCTSFAISQTCSCDLSGLHVHQVAVPCRSRGQPHSLKSQKCRWGAQYQAPSTGLGRDDFNSIRSNHKRCPGIPWR